MSVTYGHISIDIIFTTHYSDTFKDLGVQDDRFEASLATLLALISSLLADLAPRVVLVVALLKHEPKLDVSSAETGNLALLPVLWDLALYLLLTFIPFFLSFFMLFCVVIAVKGLGLDPTLLLHLSAKSLLLDLLKVASDLASFYKRVLLRLHFLSLRSGWALAFLRHQVLFLSFYDHLLFHL